MNLIFNNRSSINFISQILKFIISYLFVISFNKHFYCDVLSFSNFVFCNLVFVFFHFHFGQHFKNFLIFVVNFRLFMFVRIALRGFVFFLNSFIFSFSVVLNFVFVKFLHFQFSFFCKSIVSKWIHQSHHRRIVHGLFCFGIQILTKFFFNKFFISLVFLADFSQTLYSVSEKINESGF